MPRHRDPDAVANWQSTPVIRAGDRACAIGRSDVRACSPGRILSRSATTDRGTELEFCSMQVRISPTTSTESPPGVVVGHESLKNT
jgi:hypothetical protein